jgi:signal transduction histidine kinase/CheY-like chemotaxis protein
MPSQERTLVHRLRIEGRVSYYDPLWRLFWIENQGEGGFIYLSNNAPVLRLGQRVLIEGTIIPDQGLRADSVTCTVLEADAPCSPIPAKGRINDTEHLDSRVISVEGYVDLQQDIDADHLRLNMIIEGRPVIAWVKPSDYPRLPHYEGYFIRAVGLYSRRFDPSKTRAQIELWIGPETQVTRLHSLQEDPAFRVDTTRISALYALPSGTLVRVRGQVLNNELGVGLILRDDSGQLQVNSCQKQRVVAGEELEVLGTVMHTAGSCTLESALYRKPALGTLSMGQAAGTGGTPQCVDQIRTLSTHEVSRGRPVTLSGTVTWALPEHDFFFLQDMTGGIRVHFNRDQMSAPALTKCMQLEGITRLGAFAPEVQLKSFRDLGAMNAPKPKPVTYEQAMTGAEDGQWVMMRGFLRRVVSDNDWRWIHVTTPSGDFVAHLQSPVNFVANVGSLIRIQGVCEATLNDQGQVSGVMLRVPFLHDITIEEDAPLDLYDLPLRPIRSLAQLGLAGEMMRVRVAGVVTDFKTGEYIQLQEEGAGLVLLCSTVKDVLPGDHIEAVGILGSEGLRPVLRESAYRKLGTEKVPEPVRLSAGSPLAVSREGLLVSVEGTLIDCFDRHDRTRLMLQERNSIFEASLDLRPGQTAAEMPELGARLRLQGICRLEYDDSRRIRGFSVRLRSPDDVVVVEPARLWTQQRALLVVGILALCSVLTSVWVYALRRRVRLQTEQLRVQLEHQQRLELGVQHAARLESLGLMAGGIAHDFNNLLTVIMGNLGLAMVNPEGARAVGDHLKDAMKGATRARDLTQQLLTFARGGNPIKAEISLADLVLEATKSELHGTAVRCDFKAEPQLRAAFVDRKQLSVVIQNITSNAVQAMPHGGTLTVELRNLRLAEVNPQQLRAGHYLSLSISDSGEGIAPEVMPRIFDPYFSTRKGRTGLGLATAYSIIRRHEGHIEVKSTPGRGTNFVILLPASAEFAPVVPVAAPPQASHQPAAGARVLLMDDEESIRRIATIVMRRLGLEVTTACDGEEALRYFREARSSGQPFDLVILDLTIPGGMGGKDTMEAIREMDTEVPAIVSSGYSSDPVMSDFKRYGFTAMVPKPYEVDQLSTAIRQILGPKTSPGPDQVV